MLDLESEVNQRPRFLTKDNTLSLDFFGFHVVKPPMPILALLPMLCACENPDSTDDWLHDNTLSFTSTQVDFLT